MQIEKPPYEVQRAFSSFAEQSDKSKYKRYEMEGS
jgi:hypothetical protein